MSRVTTSLQDMGFDLASVDSVPVLAAKASQDELDNLIQKMKEKCPGIDFDPKSVIARATFMSRVVAQRQRLEEKMRLWTKREHDCTALKPYDDMFTRIYNEMKVSLSLSLSVVCCCCCLSLYE